MHLTVILGLLSVAISPYFSPLHAQFNETIANVSRTGEDDLEASRYLENLNNDLAANYGKLRGANFVYYVNNTEENKLKLDKESSNLRIFMLKVANDTKRFNWQHVNSDTRRKFKLLSKLGYSLRNETEYRERSKAEKALNVHYGHIILCDYKNRTHCDKNFGEALRSTNDVNELTYYWLDYEQKGGTAARELFENFVKRTNDVAHLRNFTSGVEMLLDDYGDDTIAQQLDDVVNAIHPLYKQIHAFLRYRMQRIYGEDNVSSRGPLPIHLVAHMLRKDRHDSVYSFLPYPRRADIDITDELVKQNFTSLKMFQLAEDFFSSLNMSKLPENFWNRSILRTYETGCDNSIRSISQFDSNGIRLADCAVVNHKGFLRAHRRLANIYYSLKYQHQPFLYRYPASVGISQGFVNAIIASVSTPKHLHRIGLLPNYVPDEGERLNRLFLKAIQTIFMTPALIGEERFLWALFRRQFEKEKWNCNFWKMQEQYCGFEAPVSRNSNDFDPPVFYGETSYKSSLRYIEPFLIEFQLYKTACIKAGQYDPNDPELPLENCDFYGSPEAGKAFRDMLSLGDSKPWPDILEAFNGERKLNASAMLEYFKPLELWLRAENAKNNVHIGWDASNKCPFL